MKWKLRWAAAKQDIWRPTELLAAFKKVGFEPSLSKTAALWSGTPVSVRLDDLDKICAALNCTVADLLESQPVEMVGHDDQDTARAAGDQGSGGASRPRPRRSGGPGHCRRVDVATRPARIGQCRGCLGWGTLVQPPYCSPCHPWRSKKANQPGTCRCCRFPALVTPEGLCRGCILAIAEFDAAWYFAPDDRGRHVQLELILSGLPRRPAVPIGSYRLRSDGRYHPPPWARRQRPEAEFNDQRVCPPTMPGQLALWRAPRSLTWEQPALIRDRRLDGYPEMKKEVSALLAEHGYTKAWGKLAKDMLRLALAVRDADGSPLIEPSARRTARTHVIYLDVVTLECADAWLHDRHSRWPRTANPHLFISRVTATDTVPVSYQYISRCFAPVRITATQLREDRVLDEARHTADPVRLMRLFGISDSTAMKYVFTAHPERQFVLPR